MDGDGDILSWSNLEVHRVGHSLALCRHGHTSLSIEGQAHC